MATRTMWLGIGLVVLGVVGYAGSGADSVTALIPSAFGVVLAVLGYVGQQEDKRALTMHIAALLALLGLLGTIPGLLDLPDLLTGDDVERPWAVAVQSIMALALLVYLVMSVRSFVAARQARQGVG
jgi:hypothetical protein